MQTKPSLQGRWLLLGAGLLLSASLAYAQSDVTQPGDVILASSPNSPASEGVANAIDNKTTKYLNFDSGTGGFVPSGFVVTPSVGMTRVTGLALQSANDAAVRDPKDIRLEGSNDETITAYDSGNWELIAEINDIPSWPSVFGPTDPENRFQTQVLEFENFKPYRHYRWTVTETQGMGQDNTCCMQIAEVELLGSVLPPDVTQPGDPIIPSSPNSPASEGVANAIDNKTTKYLNFDSGTDGFIPSGLVVSPSIGRTVISGISMQSANDAAVRDPKDVRIEGSNDETITGFSSGNWEVIAEISDIPSWPSVFGPTDAENRFKVQTVLFDNFVPYRHYRVTVTETQGMGQDNTCCMQIAEIELLGTGAPQDITQPGDAIIPSSPNSPASEGVANAIDNKTTKYLNFDSGTDGFQPSGFVVTPSVTDAVVIGLAMQSANDAAVRDPKDVRLEGSNDDTISGFNSGNWEVIAELNDIPSWPSVFGPTDAEHRFQTQEFYFPNTKAYKHYRWTVTETQGMGPDNTCCMQIAEVELLAVTVGAPCESARFLAQPVNTPVLEGEAATFSVDVNGPWPLQWYRNGELIPGATQRTFTTDAVTAENASDTYQVAIVGCETSTEVVATIFTPSATESIGINFEGSGANAAPTAMLATDIAGAHLQAYWNNAGGAAGDLPDFSVDPVVPLLNSNNEESTITFNYTASGSWGSGTGEDAPTQRMLNGLIGSDDVDEGATLSFFNVPDGSHAVLIYIVSPPLQFQNIRYTVTGETEQNYYIRAMNSDEYNAAPGFYRGSSTSASNPTIANYVRFDNVRPLDGAITVTVTVLTDADRETGIGAIQLLLNAEQPPAPPTITSQPQPTVVVEGNTTTLSVTATGEDLSYQWRRNGRNLPNGGAISGATTSTLTIGPATAAEEGIYSVAVFNAGGSEISANASLSLTECDINQDLAVYLKFNSTSGSTASNSASGGQDADVFGTPDWAAGKVGNALGFDGVESYGILENYPKATDQLSVSGWVYIETEAVDNISFIRNAQGGLGTSGASIGQFEFGTDLDLVFYESRPTAAVGVGPSIVRVTAPEGLTTAEWHHVAFTADGAQLRLYVNGEQVAAADYRGTINQPAMDFLSFGARLARDESSGELVIDPAAPYNLTGDMDDFAIWNRALTASEVAMIHAAGTQGNEATSIEAECPPDQGGGGGDEPVLDIARSGDSVVISWEGDGFRLQSATEVDGEYSDVAGVTGNSHTVPITSGNRFYRLIK